MFVSLNGRCMITVLPERSLTILALIVSLRCAAGDELHPLGVHVFARVLHQQMNVVGRDDVVENTKAETLLGLEQPMQITPSVAFNC